MNTQIEAQCSRRVLCQDVSNSLYHSSGTIVSTRHLYDQLMSFDVEFDDGRLIGFTSREINKFSDLP